MNIGNLHNKLQTTKKLQYPHSYNKEISLQSKLNCPNITIKNEQCNKRSRMIFANV